MGILYLIAEEVRKIDLLNAEHDDSKHKLRQNVELRKEIADLQSKLEKAKSSKKAYPDLVHSISNEELKTLESWIKTRLKGFFVKNTVSEGIHNVMGEKDRKAYLSPEFFDAQLMPLGWSQVDNLCKHVRAHGLAEKIELVISSPLLRTMQTAVSVFGGVDLMDGVEVPPLMVENAGNSDRSAISNLNCTPFVAVEDCRECLGVHPCDKRRSTSEYQPLFPAIDFPLIENDEDVLWKADIREGNNGVAARGKEFIDWENLNGDDAS